MCRNVVLPNAAFLEKCRHDVERGAWNAAIGRSFVRKDRDITVVMIAGIRGVARSFAMVEMYEMMKVLFVFVVVDGGGVAVAVRRVTRDRDEAGHVRERLTMTRTDK